jgi:hypothetical protein
MADDSGDRRVIIGEGACKLGRIRRQWLVGEALLAPADITVAQMRYARWSRVRGFKASEICRTCSVNAGSSGAMSLKCPSRAKVSMR